MTSQEQSNNSERVIFESNIRREVSNFLTGEKYEMLGGEDMIFTEEDLKKITKICNYPENYEILFAKRLEGRPYSEEDARGFIEWLKDGWKKQTHFVFLIRKSDNEIIGAIDIKSANLDRAEIGYWSDKEYSGFMTNTVNELSALAKDVGFIKLFAGVLAKNEKSVGVLERSGFVKIKEDMKDDKPHFEYEKEL